jgi:predicted secreted hydrolase
MAHFAITDSESGKHFAFERFSRGAAGLAGAAADPFQVWLENWEVQEIDQKEYRLVASQEGIAIDLSLVD